jgi:putative ABC transport system permease protein
MLFEALVVERMRQNPLLSVVSIFAIAIGVTVVVALDLTSGIALESFSSNATAIVDRTNLQVLGFGPGIDERALISVRGIPGVIDARPIIEGSAAVKPRTEKSPITVLRVVGVDLMQPLPRDAEIRDHLPGVFALRGSAPYPDLLVFGRGAIISAQVADRYQLSTRASFDALAGSRRLALHVAAVLPRTLTGIDSSVIFVDIATAQELFGKFGRLDRIDCVVDPARAAQVLARVAAVLPSRARVIQKTNDSERMRQTVLALRRGLRALSFATLALAGVLIYNVVAVSVVQRRTEIGILRALGASRGQMLRAFLLEGVALGFVGSLIAFPAAVLLAQWSADRVAPAFQEYNGFITLVKAVLVGASLTLLSIIAPAIIAARIPPAVAIDGPRIEGTSASPSSGFAIAGLTFLALGFVLAYVERTYIAAAYGAGLAFIIGSFFCVPPLIALAAHLARRSADRISPSARLAAAMIATSTGRTGLAIVSLIFAVGVVVMVFILVDSFRASLVSWTNATLKGDLYVQPLREGPAGQARLSSAIVERIGSVPGVARVYEDDSPNAAVVYAQPRVSLIELRSSIVRSVTPNSIDISITRELRQHTLSMFERTFALMYALGSIGGVIAILSLAAALFALVLERRDEIGLLRYIGLTTNATQQMVLYQAALVGGLAAALGVVLGALLTLLAEFMIERQVWSTQLDFRIPYERLAATFIIAVIAALIASLYPARVAARIATSTAAKAE